MAEIKVAIVTFEHFNELDSFIALHLIGRVQEYGIRTELVAPESVVTSMNGIRVTDVRPLEWSHDADVVLFGSGPGNREAVDTPTLMARLKLDSRRQLVGSQCSGALVLHHLGMLGNEPICTDVITRRVFDEQGVRVANAPFAVNGNLATAGGCLAAQYLSAWVLTRTLDWKRASEAINYVAPVGEEQQTLMRVQAALVAAGVDGVTPHGTPIKPSKST